MEQPASWLVTVRDGKIVSIRNFVGHDAAQDAAAEERDPE
jgi:ketosteroid isomerase-like protein